MKMRSFKNEVVSNEPVRRLSPWRVLLALIILAGLGFASVFGVQKWQSMQLAASTKPWFAGYVDVTATPTFAFEQIGATTQRNAVLSFIVASPSQPCMPSWGGVYTMEQASARLDLDRRIARLQQQDGSVAVSFGGLKNNELAVSCTNTNELQTAYKSVIERYNVDTIDLDLELAGLTDAEAGDRRAEAIAKLQADRRATGKHLAVWVTLPVTPQGLSEPGTNAISKLLAKGVDLAGVNIMTMAYGESRQNQSMLEASKNALVQTHRQLGILYERAGIALSDATLWAKLGATPMIGQNDDVKEMFTLDDAKSFNEFARSRGISRLSMWSTNRDVPCGSNYVDVKIVSDSCSGVKQEGFQFSQLLGVGFGGSITESAGLVTKQETPSTVQADDDPANSPYQIWSPTGAYLQGTKVVWHKNVYQAKWWTQGDLPDSPVLQAWETPWELVGPVLPGEKPVKQATLPAGTYPEWSGEATYDTSQRVLFKGIPYQAKWWNQGDSPEAASSNPDTSPWAPLTQAQIDAVATQKQ